MNVRWLVMGLAGLSATLAMVAADPALARARHHKAKPVHVASCAPNPANGSWQRFWFAGPPEPNGCAPPVFSNGHYIGQDPDRNIRAQLLRQPNTGYTNYGP